MMPLTVITSIKYNKNIIAVMLMRMFYWGIFYNALGFTSPKRNVVPPQLFYLCIFFSGIILFLISSIHCSLAFLFPLMPHHSIPVSDI